MGDTTARAENAGEINPLHVGEITFFGRSGGGSVTVFRPPVLDHDSRDEKPSTPTPYTATVDA